MSTVTHIGGRCAGCSTPVPPSRGRGRPRKWCSERCRKLSYDMECVDCGGRVDGTTPSNNRHEPVCRSCAPAHFKTWTREAIIFAIQEWADEHGGIPPTATQWRTGQGVPTATVQIAFGSWNAGIEAAGFESRPVGSYGRPGEDDAVVRQAVALYRSGLSASAVAEETDCTVSAVLYRLKKGGQRRLPASSTYWTRDERAAAILRMDNEQVAA